LVEFYKICKGKELPEALRRLTEAEANVTQLQRIVTQIRVNCDTKGHVCNTILDAFKKQGRDIDNITSQDRFWISAQLEKQGSELGLDVDGFLEYVKRQSGSDE